MLTPKETTDQLLGYLSVHGIAFDFPQFEEMTRLFCRCQGKRFEVEAFAGFLAIVGYALMEKPVYPTKDYLEYSKSVIQATHGVQPSVELGIPKLYQVFAAAREQSAITGLPLRVEFGNQLGYLAELFTSCQPDPDEGGTL